MNARIRSGIVIAAVVAACIVLRGWFARVTFACVTVLGVWEMLQAFKARGTNVIKLPALIFSVTAMPLYALLRDAAGSAVAESMLALTLSGCMFSAVSVICVIVKGHVDFDAVIGSVMPIIYPGMIGVMMYPLADMSEPFISSVAIAELFVIAFLSDVFGYIIGCRYGKHRLSPEISPKKSIEGAVAGIVAGTVAAPCVLYIVKLFNMIVPFAQYKQVSSIPMLMLLGLAGSVLSQFGDLLASLIKRECGIKDYGKLIPGHGGIMDRMDGVLFCGMACFVYFFYLV